MTTKQACILKLHPLTFKAPHTLHLTILSAATSTLVPTVISRVNSLSITIWRPILAQTTLPWAYCVSTLSIREVMISFKFSCPSLSSPRFPWKHCDITSFTVRRPNYMSATSTLSWIKDLEHQV
eukprot:jgi/Botrbrau1/7657/Bobra.0159s0099.1